MVAVDLSRVAHVLPDDLVQRVIRGSPVMCVLIAEEGRLELREIDPDQAWFWAPAWQEGERDADRDVKEGRTTRYCSDEEFLAALDAARTPTSE